MSEPFIEINNLSKSYETPAGPLCVLGGIDLTIPKGTLWPWTPTKSTAPAAPSTTGW